MAVADLAHLLEVALGRREAPARILHRLQEDRRDRLRAFEEDRVLDRVATRVGERGLVLAQRVAVAVGVADMRAPGHQRFERRPQPGHPVIASAPNVVPWYAVRRAITL